MLKLIFPATFILACSPAFAQTQSGNQQQPQQQQQAKLADAKAKNRLICQDVGDIGSRLSSHRVCMTAEQWKQQQQIAQGSVADAQQVNH